MKLAIIGNGNLTAKELKGCIPDFVSEIMADDGGILNPGLEGYCKEKNIKLLFSDKGLGNFYNVMEAVFFSDAFLSFEGTNDDGARFFRYIASDNSGYDIIILKSGDILKVVG